MPSITLYPVARYSPSYNKSKTVSIDGVSSFKVVDPANPTRINNANLAEIDGKLYLYRWDDAQHQYVPDMTREISRKDAVYYANATAAKDLASVSNVEISNIRITNVDPRYPILLEGLVDSKVKNVILRNISVQYRGGLSLQEAVEQRQLGTYWVYSRERLCPHCAEAALAGEHLLQQVRGPAAPCGLEERHLGRPTPTMCRRW